MTKAILFDWDGVIVDTFPIALKVFKKIFEEMDLDFTEESLRTRFGSGVRTVISSFLDEKGVEYTEERLQELAKKKTDIQVTLTDETELLPGALALLEQFSGKFKLAVASSNRKKVIVDTLEKKNLTKYFQAVITADDADELKPSPEIFLKAAEKLSVDPSDCIVFEDSPHGIKAAKNANMKSIAVLTGPSGLKLVERENPDLIVGTLEDTAKIAQFLSN